MGLEKYTTLELINECVKKNSEAERLFYLKYSPKLIDMCYHFFISKENSKDILSEAFVSIFKNLYKFDITKFNQENADVDGEHTEKVLCCWMRKIMRNKILDFIRVYKNKKNFETIDIFEQFFVTEPKRGNSYDYNLLLKAIETLPKQTRKFFTLHVIDGLRHEEISKQLNVSLSSSKVGVLRAKEMLKNKINYEYFV